MTMDKVESMELSAADLPAVEVNSIQRDARQENMKEHLLGAIAATTVLSPVAAMAQTEV